MNFVNSNFFSAFDEEFLVCDASNHSTHSDVEEQEASSLKFEGNVARAFTFSLESVAKISPVTQVKSHFALLHYKSTGSLRIF